jgi:glyoxylase-like metal-dependent hydrolase (beta-lactamase superfamily II)
VQVELDLLVAGFCTHPERMVLRTGALRIVRFPAMFALIRHPDRGYILFDTGYTPRFHDETRRFPNKIYAKLTPVVVGPGETACEQLRARGITPAEVTHVIISHFHADHIAGLCDFPRAKFVYLAKGLDAVRRLGGLRATFAGFLPGLLPADFAERSVTIGPHLRCAGPAPISARFDEVYDLFGDGSILAVALPGHVSGQLGIYVQSAAGQHFLVADACWLSRAIRDDVMPSRLTALISDDYRSYRRTLGALHALSRQVPELDLIPSHCSDAIASYRAKAASAGGAQLRVAR